jgi:hypothetical protein
MKVGKTAKAIFNAAIGPASAILLLCSCQTSNAIQDSPDTAIGSKSASKIKPVQFSDEDPLAMKKASEQFLNDILTGMKERNYKLFIKNFTDEMKIEINEKAFQVMVDEFEKKKGPYVSRQYFGDLTQGYFKVFLWKAQFEVPKELVDLAKKQKKDPSTLLRSDTLIRLEVAKLDNTYMVMGIYFQ